MKVANARNFVIGKFYAKVIFQAREQLQSLQAVDSQFFEEVIIGLKVGTRNFEVRGGKSQNFIGCLFKIFHQFGSNNILQENSVCVRLRQVRMRACVFDEFAQALHNGWQREEPAKSVNFAAKLFGRQRLDKLF